MEQETYIGFGTIQKLEAILSSYDLNNVFLVTGKQSYSSCGAERALKRTLRQYNVERFSDFEVNPNLKDVRIGIDLFRKSDPGIVISVGGGSVIDMAKLVNILSAQEREPVGYMKGENNVENRMKPLIAIPTTAGSGTEATQFAVVYIDKTKYSVAHKFILPQYAIVDPQFTIGLPPAITASTGMDALSQATESFWAVDSTEESKADSAEAIKLAMGNLESAVNEPTEDSRLKMMKASNLAGRAINITRTTAPHAVSYTFTTHFGIPHGHAVGLTLGKFLVYNNEVDETDCTDQRGAPYVRKTIAELCVLLGAEDADSARNRIDSLMTAIGLEDIFKLNLKREDLDLIAENVNTERMINNPRRITREGLNRILK